LNSQERFNKRDCLKALHSQIIDVDELTGILKGFQDRNIIGPLVKVNTGGAPGLFHDVNPKLLQEVN